MKSVYGKELRINCMKFTKRGLIETQYGKLYTFSAEHDDVTVVTPENPALCPSEFFGNTEIETQCGAVISGKKIWGCSDKPPGKIHKGESDGRSGRHSRQTVRIKGSLCYAVIISDWTEESIEIHPLDYIRSLSEKFENTD